MSLWLWISWHTVPGEGLLERAKDEEGGRGGRGFLDGQDLPLRSGTEGIGCKKTGIDVMPHPCGVSLARPFPQMKCQNRPVDTRSYLICPCSNRLPCLSPRRNECLKCPVFVHLRLSETFALLLIFRHPLGSRHFPRKQIVALCDYFQMAKYIEVNTGTWRQFLSNSKL